MLMFPLIIRISFFFSEDCTDAKWSGSDLGLYSWSDFTAA